ncbi:MAG TPA: N-formylglutamate amidohydrolase [Sphingomonadaceae bacterium]|nr:N-formylglutamate amidohydrolase [Sphingomonadaceae bacterium]
MSAPPSDSPFLRLGPAHPACPVVLAVPHAGRAYPDALRAMAAVPVARLEALEDRHADLLVADAVVAGATAFIARRARSWIDLNRDEREMDPAMIDPTPRAQDVVGSAKVRGGLGLIPRRLNGVGHLWRGRFDAADIARRIEEDHRPWHSALAATLAEARARFGAALLLDCHSMPPLTAHGLAGPPDVVIGDRFGRSAAPALVERLMAIAEGDGLRVACNSPYAGGYALDRHGAPAEGRHAIQVEIDRRLYLMPDLSTPGPGVGRMRALLARMAMAMADELGTPMTSLAAE